MSNSRARYAVIGTLSHLVTVPLYRVPIEHEAICFLSLERHPVASHAIPARLAYERRASGPPVWGGVFGKTRISAGSRLISAWVVDSKGICGIRSGYDPQRALDEIYRAGDVLYLRAVYRP